MRDPHVESLRYRIVSPDDVSFDNPPPVKWKTDVCTLVLEGGMATARMRRHYPTVEAARRDVEPYLRAWEVSCGLRYGSEEVGFRIDSSEVIDRNPDPDKQVISLGVAIASAEFFGEATIRVIHRSYPDPPQGFAVSPDVETLWRRYLGYWKGREPLAAMGYFCLTALERIAGGRGAASKLFGVSGRVLNKLGELTSARGNQRTARKAGAQYRPLTKKEEAWIEQVVTALIRRAGEHAFNPSASFAQLTMANFPKV